MSPTPVPPTSRSPVPRRGISLRLIAGDVTTMDVFDGLRKAGEKCAFACPECRDIAGLPERDGLPPMGSKRQPRQDEDPAAHRRYCPGVDIWTLLARLIG